MSTMGLNLLGGGAPFSQYRGAPSLHSNLWELNTDVWFEQMGFNWGLTATASPLC